MMPFVSLCVSLVFFFGSIWRFIHLKYIKNIIRVVCVAEVVVRFAWLFLVIECVCCRLIRFGKPSDNLNGIRCRSLTHSECNIAHSLCWENDEKHQNSISTHFANRSNQNDAHTPKHIYFYFKFNAMQKLLILYFLYNKIIIFEMSIRMWINLILLIRLIVWKHIEVNEMKIFFLLKHFSRLHFINLLNIILLQNISDSVRECIFYWKKFFAISVVVAVVVVVCTEIWLAALYFTWFFFVTLHNTVKKAYM